jgi:uncharacterized coiled-coil protein SlyX
MNIGSETPILLNLWTLITVIIFAVIQTVKLTTHKNRTDFRIKTLETENQRQEDCIKDLTRKINDADVTFMEIRTKLANIESLLVELKTQTNSKR